MTRFYRPRDKAARKKFELLVEKYGEPKYRPRFKYKGGVFSEGGSRKSGGVKYQCLWCNRTTTGIGGGIPNHTRDCPVRVCTIADHTKKNEHKICGSCGGTGTIKQDAPTTVHKAMDSEGTCLTCGGSGVRLLDERQAVSKSTVRCPMCDGDGLTDGGPNIRRCSHCKGTGHVRTKKHVLPCLSCGGTGKEEAESRIIDTVPKSEIGRPQTKRQTWDNYFLRIAEIVASRSTCPRKQIGAVLVKDKIIVSTGYNGSIRGLPHCTDVGCDMVNTHCERTIHAEANALVQAAQTGVCVNEAECYVTASPCWTCFKMIANAGIKRIVYREFYRDERIFKAAEQLGIELVHLEK